MQDAFDRANQRRIISKLTCEKKVIKETEVPRAQAVFCIDVRSELYRRNLEVIDPEIATMGFAGIFAFPVKYVPLGHTQGSNNCPVLLNTSHTIKETTGSDELDQKAISSRSVKQHIKKAEYRCGRENTK